MSTSADVPYLKLWRAGRYQPRWEPGPKLRRANLAGRALKDDAGNWLQPDAAKAEAVRLNAEAAAIIESGKRARTSNGLHPRRMEALAAQWFDSVDFRNLGERTRADYRSKLELFFADGFRDKPVAAITKPHLVAWWQRAYDTRGHAMANGIKAVASALLSYAEIIGWRPPQSNPAFNLKRPQLPPRVAIWDPMKVQRFVETADQMGLYSVGDAVVVALHTSQRLADVLAMPDTLFQETRVALSQFKTNALIDSPMTPQLLARVAAIKARRNAAPIVRLGREIVIEEATDEPYNGRRFNEAFRTVRNATLKAYPELAQSRRFAPGLDDLRFQDLRDTGITRLALADCTLPQIRSISGHSPSHITSVIQHYLALDPEMADAAIGKLTNWLDRNRIAV